MRVWISYNTVMPRCIRYSRPKSSSSESLSLYLSKKFKYFSEEEWRTQVADGYLAVNGTVQCNPDYELQQQDIVMYSPPPSREPAVDFEHIDILFEDNDVCVCCKNGSIPVTEGGRYCEHTLCSFMNKNKGTTSRSASLRQSKRCREEPGSDSSNAVSSSNNAPNNALHAPHYYPIHRLDKETSGLLVLGKSLEVTKKLSLLFEEQSTSMNSAVERRILQGRTISAVDFETLSAESRSVHKCYIAVLTGAATTGKVDIVVSRIGAYAGDATLGTLREHEKLCKLKMFCKELELSCKPDSPGKVAVSRITILDSSTACHCSVARVDILTGRTHQIRLHCAHLGFPILGDKLYTTTTPGVYGGSAAVPDDIYLSRVRDETLVFHPDFTRCTPFRCRRHLLHAAQLSFPYRVQESCVLSFVAHPQDWLLRDVVSDTPSAVETLRSMIANAMTKSFGSPPPVTTV